MKILYIHSGDDYAAVTFEDELNKDVKKYWDLANGERDKCYENKKTGIEFDAYEFGEVDPKFIEFIKNEVLDYDDSKHNNFYVVEE